MLRATDNTRTPTPADPNTRTPTPADPRLRPRLARSAKNLFDRDAMAHNLNAVDGCRSYLTLFGAVGAGVVGATGLRGLLFFVGTYVLGSVALLTRMRCNPADYTSESLTKFVITGAPGYALSFVLFWTLAYALVHIY